MLVKTNVRKRTPNNTNTFGGYYFPDSSSDIRPPKTTHHFSHACAAVFEASRRDGPIGCPSACWILRRLRG